MIIAKCKLMMTKYLGHTTQIPFDNENEINVTYLHYTPIYIASLTLKTILTKNGKK